MAGFAAIWCLAVWRNPSWLRLDDSWRLQLAVITRGWFGAIAPVGTGTLILPVMVSGGEFSPHAFRTLCFLIQAVALTSGTLYVLCRRLTVDWALASCTILGCALGTPLGLRLIAPHISSAAVVAVYAIVWGSFGLAALLWLRDHPPLSFPPPPPRRILRYAAFASGIIGGGAISSILGAGSCLPFYAMLVFLRRLDIRGAAATCTVVSAANSFIGAGSLMAQGEIEPAAFHLWLPAAPIACLTIPLAWILLNRIKPYMTLLLAGTYCVLQAAWLILQFRSEWPAVGLVYIAAALAYGLFMYRILHLIGMAMARSTSTMQGAS